MKTEKLGDTDTTEDETVFEADWSTIAVCLGLISVFLLGTILGRRGL